MRLKICKACGSKFTPARPMQLVCGWQCSIEYSRKLKDKREAKEHREAKVKAKSRQDWLKDAQNAFNKWIRLRDADLPCISSGKYHTGQYHAGHYRTTAAAPQLRFDPDNVHKQSSSDNNHKSGNIIEYRINLIKKIGLERVEALENNNTVHKWTIEELKEIKAKYTLMTKEFKSANTDMV